MSGKVLTVQLRANVLAKPTREKRVQKSEFHICNDKRGGMANAGVGGFPIEMSPGSPGWARVCPGIPRAFLKADKCGEVGGS